MGYRCWDFGCGWNRVGNGWVIWDRDSGLPGGDKEGRLNLDAYRGARAEREEKKQQAETEVLLHGLAIDRG